MSNGWAVIIRTTRYIVTGATCARLEREVLAHRETRPEDDGKAEHPRLGKRKEPYLSRMLALRKDMFGPAPVRPPR